MAFQLQYDEAPGAITYSNKDRIVIKVLWIIDALGPGGAESLMVPLLTSLKDCGVESHVCFMQVRAGNPIADELRKTGIPVDQVKIRNLRNPMDLWRLMKYIRQQQPDVVHTQLETSDVLGTLAAWLLGIPRLSTLHTLDMDLPTKRRRQAFRNLLHQRILRLLSDRVIAVSEITRRYYINLGFKTEKLLTMYNGIDLSKFMNVKLPRAHKGMIFGLPEHSIIITTVAVLREAKGIQYMLNALPDLLADLPNLYYVIVGDGDYRETLENLTVSLGIADHVKFMSYRKDIPEILSASDMFVLPTLRDALPTVLFEAMAVGMPIIASNVGGVPEILTHNVDALLVPAADANMLANACRSLVFDKGLAGRLATAARKTVMDRFDTRHQAKTLLFLYNQMVTEHAL